MTKQHPVYTLTNECKDCYKCVRHCPVKAIKIENDHASVIAEKSFSCGHCVQVCPTNAKCVRTDLEKVKNLFIAKKDVYVSLAPSWRSVFENSAKKMIAVLKKLGFKEVSETALGAQEVSIHDTEILNKMEKGLLISSACPVIVDYIRLYKPEFAKYITPIGSPAKTHAKMLKNTYGNDIAVVFIGPCIGKKNEADEDDGLIDVSITFEELKYWIADEIGDISSIKRENDYEFVPYSAHEGTLYPINGGMNETIRKVGIKPEVQLMEICTIPAFEKALENLDPEKLAMPVFVEALACDSGCITGPCIASNKASISSISDVMYKVKVRDNIPQQATTVVECKYEPKGVVNSRYTLEEIKSALKMVKTTGYGVASPSLEDMKLDTPEIIKQGSRYGVKLKAVAPSIHMIRVDVESTFEPIIGSEIQSKELIDYLMKDQEESPSNIWKSEIFGRSLDVIVKEGIQAKLSLMPENARHKLQQTLSKLVNKGSGNLFAIVL